MLTDQQIDFSFTLKSGRLKKLLNILNLNSAIHLLVYVDTIAAYYILYILY